MRFRVRVVRCTHFEIEREEGHPAQNKQDKANVRNGLQTNSRRPATRRILEKGIYRNRL